jgi:nucleoid DNA-binding protein
MAGKRMTKSQFVAAVAQKAGLEKKQAAAALDALNTVVAHELGKKGPGEVMIPGLLKLNVVDKPAVKAHEGINPFTKQPAMFKAKPARKVIKARPVKAFKDAV